MRKDPTLSTEELAQLSQHWAEHSGDFSGFRHWTEIPEVKARINRKVTRVTLTPIYLPMSFASTSKRVAVS